MKSNVIFVKMVMNCINKIVQNCALNYVQNAQNKIIKTSALNVKKLYMVNN